MIENTSYVTCRPSQWVNLDNFLMMLVLLPALVLLDWTVRRYVPGMYLPAAMAFHLSRMPVYLAVIAALDVAHQVLRVRCTRYEITPEELKYHTGILRRKHEYVELYRVKDFRIDQSLIYRLLGIGNLIIYTSDKTTPVFRMHAIPKPEETYAVLRALVECNRREKHVFEVD